MPRVVWTPVAESDLDEILFYISFVDRNPNTGERIYFEIRDRLNEHLEKALPGHRHPSAPDGWLYVKHKRWLIFYQPTRGGIEVMRVIDAVRDLPRHLRDR
jgi:plasmid stabilization system protein ParE